MKTIIRGIAVLGALALSSTAFALSLGPGDAGWEDVLPKNPDAGDVECIVSGDTYSDNGTSRVTDDFWTGGCVPTGDLVELYKQDQGAADDTGPFAPSYATTFNPDDEEAEDATIVWDLESDTIECSEDWPCYLLVKDGNQVPIWYLFDVTGWDGEETIDLTGFWPGDGGGISHVSIFGHAMRVPEPGTLALLGLGLLGMGLMRRRQVS